MKKYLKLIRIKHWIKNLLVFLPMICGNVINQKNLYSTLLGFISFCFMSSFIYIINDIKDIEKDKLHPRKKDRPIANGQISKKKALIISLILFIISLTFNYLANMSLINYSLILLLLYLITNILYSLGLKNIAIADIIILTLSYIIRIYYGASLTNIIVSNWLFLTITSGALFSGLGKRKKELSYNKNVRIVLKDYNEAFLDRFQYVSLTLTLVFYSLWTIEKNVKYLVYTIPLLIIIFMMYSLNLEKNSEGDPATILYSDKILLLSCFIYTIIMIVILI